MDIENLIRMANQIGEFFEPMPNREQSLSDIALHLKRSWAPVMRRQLLDHIERNGGNGIREIVKEAVTQHGSTLQ